MPAQPAPSALRSLNALFFVIALGLAIGQLAWFGPGMPSKVASHFDTGGHPNGFMGRQAFLALMAGVHLILALSMGGAAIWLPSLPNAWINMPHKDYWLAPERRSASLRALGLALFDMGTLTYVLLLWVVQGTIEVNLGERETLGDFWWPMGLYLGLTFVWVVRLHRRFGKPPGHWNRLTRP